MGSAGRDAVDGAAVALSDVGVSEGDGEEVDEAIGGAVVCASDHGGSRSAKAARGPAGEAGMNS